MPARTEKGTRAAINANGGAHFKHESNAPREVLSHRYEVTQSEDDLCFDAPMIERIQRESRVWVCVCRRVGGGLSALTNQDIPLKS